LKSQDQVGGLLLITYRPFFSSLKLKRWSKVRWVGGFRQSLIKVMNFLKVKRVKWGRLGGFPSITYPHSEKKFKLEAWGEGWRLGLPLFSHTHIMNFFLTWRDEARAESWVGFCQSPTHIMSFFKVVGVTSVWHVYEGRNFKQ